MFRRLTATCLLAATACSGPVFADQNPSSQTLLALASRYVGTFVDRFSNVRADEHYVQEWKTNGGISLMRREWTAEFCLTQIGDSGVWQAFRDVFEVNGVPIRDRQDRLERLFLQPTDAQAMGQAAAISAESARYNISNVQRTINQPLFVLIFLQAANRDRFSYSVDRLDKSAGENVWIVDYKESARPTMVRGTSNKDLPARGRFWIDSVSGRIVRTELRLEDNLQSTLITAAFGADDRFSIDVPVEMEEQYSVKGNAGKISAKATYGRFREFGVRTEESLK